MAHTNLDTRRRLLSTLHKGATLASRRHLENQGRDGSSVYERAREAQERRAQQAMQAATDHMMPKQFLEAREEHARARLRGSAKGRDALVETSIQSAIKNGVFDQIEGSGRPFAPRVDNPYEDMSGMRVAHRVLKNAGSAPAWVEQNRVIRDALHKARLRLEEAWITHSLSSLPLHKFGHGQLGAPAGPAAAGAAAGASAAHDGNGEHGRSRGPAERAALTAASSASSTAASSASSTVTHPAPPPPPAASTGELLPTPLEEPCPVATQWATAVHAFSDDIGSINKQIRSYNLIAPSAVPHLFPVLVVDEIADLRASPPPRWLSPASSRLP